MKLKGKNYLRKKKFESTDLTRQTWNSCHEIERKKIDVFQLQLITIFKEEIERKQLIKKKKKNMNQLGQPTKSGQTIKPGIRIMRVL